MPMLIISLAAEVFVFFSRHDAMERLEAELNTQNQLQARVPRV